MDINLNPGEYNATVTYEDACAISKITVMSTVDGENITKIFRNATQYYATFWDSEGYRLNNTEVEFNINGVFYYRKTDDEGVARLNINLNPGEYIITAKNPNSGEMSSNVVTVLPNIAENHNLIKYYRNDSQYVVRLLDDEGNPKPVQYYPKTPNVSDQEVAWSEAWKELLEQEKLDNDALSEVNVAGDVKDLV